MRIEKLLWIVAFIAFLTKLLGWPKANILLIVDLSAIVLIYFPAGFYFFCDRNIKNQNLVLSIISGIFLALIAEGLLFKIMYWPSGQSDLLVGLIMGLIMLTITYFLRSVAAEALKTYYNNMLLRQGFLFGLALIFSFTPDSTLLKIQYRNDPELARLKILHYANPNNEEYKKQHDSYLLKLDSLQHK